MVVNVQTVTIAIASASAAAGIMYYSLQIRHQTKARQTDLVMRLRVEPAQHAARAAGKDIKR